MIARKLALQKEDLARIHKRLSDSLAKPKNDEVRDGVIKRFELCTDVYWKTLQLILFEECGKALASPKPVIREAIANNVIPADERYLR